MKIHIDDLLTTSLLFLCMATDCIADPLVLADSIKTGDTVSGAIKLGRRVIALPRGNWQVIARSERNPSTDGTAQMSPMVSINFQELLENKITRTLQVEATTYSIRANWNDEPCKNKGDSYYIDDKKIGINDQFCIRVSYTHDFLDGARGETFLAWAHDVKLRGISYSTEMPYVQVTRYNSADYLRMLIRFNPIVYGIPPSKEKPRQFNDWNPTSLAAHPQRAKFYESLRAWAPDFAAAVNRAFKGDETLTERDFGDPNLTTLP